MSKLILLAIAAAALIAAPARAASYTASQATSLVGAAEVVTVQAPGAAGTRPTALIRFQAAAITCSVACDITVERDGTAASTTALAPAAVNRQSAAPITTAYRSSNVGTGTTLATYSIAASGTLVLDLSDKWLRAGGDNLTIRTSSITGNVKINIQWSEE